MTTRDDTVATEPPPAPDQPRQIRIEARCRPGTGCDLPGGVGRDRHRREVTDPFDATLLLAGTDTAGREVAVWIRLTPTTINDLTEQLTQVLIAQQQTPGSHRQLTDTDEAAPTSTRTTRSNGRGGSSGSSTRWGSGT